MEKVVLYTRVKPVNKKYLEKMSLDTNHPVSTCLDAILDAARLKREMKLKPKPIKALEKVKAVQDKKRKKIRELSSRPPQPTA